MFKRTTSRGREMANRLWSVRANLVKRRLILLSVDTGGVKELTTAALGEEPVLGDEAPAVSPDGLKLVFVRQTTSGIAGLYLMPLAGGEPRRLTQFGSTFPGVAWTADGRELVYAGRVRRRNGPVEALGGNPSGLASETHRRCRVRRLQACPLAPQRDRLPAWPTPALSSIPISG